MVNEPAGAVGDEDGSPSGVGDEPREEVPGTAGAPRPLPFPDSLCHSCAAPPRYVRTHSATYILCPLLAVRYPRQPVRECALYRRRDAESSG
jgi:hypothetical protein